jgi:hypothetical protein
MTTKLEELKAAWEAAAYDACVTAKGVTEYAADAWDAAEAAWVAYQDELEKTQEENSDD